MKPQKNPRKNPPSAGEPSTGEPSTGEPSAGDLKAGHSTTVSATPVAALNQSRRQRSHVHPSHVHPSHGANGSTDSAVAQQDSERSLQQTRLRLAEASRQVQNTGWLIELMQSLASQTRFSTACHELTSQLQTHMNLVRVAIAWKGDANRQKVVSISGIAQLDTSSDDVRQVQSCLDEAITRETIGCWPVAIGQDGTGKSVSVDSMLAHKQVAGRDREVISVPLITKAGDTVGSLMLVASRGQLTATGDTIAFIDAAARPLADVLAGSQRGEGTRLTRLVRWYRSTPVAKRAIAATAVVAALAAAWIPIDYKIACPSLIEPVERRFSVAPHDGLLQQTTAEPGDVVAVGQTLASMDGREVSLELAGLVAEHRRAIKKHDAYLAAHQTTDALQAELEIQRLQTEIELLRYRQDNLTLSAPIAGIVLAGSMDRRENYPVDQGQVLYEIAPLDELRVELSVDSSEVSHVAEGMTVEMMFAGFGGETFAATVEKIRPQSEIRDDENVFVVECLLANTDGRLRPGMKGHAKIQGDEHSIGWIALHRAWEQVCMRSPW